MRPDYDMYEHTDGSLFPEVMELDPIATPYQWCDFRWAVFHRGKCYATLTTFRNPAEAVMWFKAPDKGGIWVGHVERITGQKNSHFLISEEIREIPTDEEVRSGKVNPELHYTHLVRGYV